MIRAVSAADLLTFSYMTQTGLTVLKRRWELELMLWPEAGKDNGKEPFGFDLRLRRGEERLLLEARLDFGCDGCSSYVLQGTQGLRDQAIQIIPSFASARTLADQRRQPSPLEPSALGEPFPPALLPEDQMTQAAYSMELPNETLFKVIDGMVDCVAAEAASAEFWHRDSVSSF